MCESAVNRRISARGRTCARFERPVCGNSAQRALTQKRTPQWTPADTQPHAITRVRHSPAAHSTSTCRTSDCTWMCESAVNRRISARGRTCARFERPVCGNSAQRALTQKRTPQWTPADTQPHAITRVRHSPAAHSTSTCRTSDCTWMCESAVNRRISARGRTCARFERPVCGNSAQRALTQKRTPQWTPADTQPHAVTLALALALSLSRSLALSLSRSLALSLSLALSRALSLSHSLTLSLSLTLSPSHPLTLSPSHPLNPFTFSPFHPFNSDTRAVHSTSTLCHLSPYTSCSCFSKTVVCRPPRSAVLLPLAPPRTDRCG